MTKTIKQIAEENAGFIPARVYGFNNLWLKTEVKDACEKTANAVVDEIKKAINESDNPFAILGGVIEVIEQLKRDENDRTETSDRRWTRDI